MNTRQRQDGRTPPIDVQVEVEKVSIPMEVDTGVSISTVSENQYHKLWPRRDYQTYSKEPITVVGSTDVNVVYQGQTATLPMVVVKGDGPTLLRRNWLTNITLNWESIYYMRSHKLYELLSQYDELFQEHLGLSRIMRPGLR